MKTLIVANARAGGGRVGRRWEHYSRSIGSCLGPAEVRFTRRAGDATVLTRDAVRSGFGRIVVVGGDGTLNECVNGLFDEAGETYLADKVSLVLFPAGTGGDFCRSIGMRRGSLDGVLDGATPRRVDVGRARVCGNHGRPVTRCFINIASFGASGLIVDRVNNTTKLLGGKGSFLLGTLRGLLGYRNQRVRLTLDGVVHDCLRINTVAVANGRYFGGAMKVAPQARIDDGLFDVVIMEDIHLLGFLRESRRLYAGTHVGRPGIRVLRGRSVRAEALGDSPVLVEVDGEQAGRLPAQYDILPQQVVVYAPWHHSEAVSGASAVE